MATNGDKGESRIEKDSAWTQQLLTGDPSAFDADQRLLQRIFETASMLLDLRTQLISNGYEGGHIDGDLFAVELARVLEVRNMIAAVRDGRKHPIFRLARATLAKHGGTKPSQQVEMQQCQMTAFETVWREKFGKTQAAAIKAIGALYDRLGLSGGMYLDRPAPTTLKDIFTKCNDPNYNGITNPLRQQTATIAAKYGAEKTAASCFYGFAIDFATMHSVEAVQALHSSSEWALAVVDSE